MGQIANGKSKKEVKKEEEEEEEQEQEGDEEQEQEQEQEEQDGLSVHSPCKIPSSALRKENTVVELELRLLEALEIYLPAKLRGVHMHFVLYGLTEYMRRRLCYAILAFCSYLDHHVEALILQLAVSIDLLLQKMYLGCLIAFTTWKWWDGNVLSYQNSPFSYFSTLDDLYWLPTQQQFAILLHVVSLLSHSETG